MSNPLLETDALPRFSAIKPEHVGPAIRQLIDDNRNQIEQLLADTNDYHWDNLIAPLDDLNDRLQRAWSPVRHLNAVCNSPELREAYNACLPLLSEYTTELGQNEALYRAYERIRNRDDFSSLSQAQQKTIDDALRDFRLSGVALEGEARQRFAEIERRLTELGARFQENLLDATHAWRKHLPDDSGLAGLPESALSVARETAEREGKTGYVLTLDFPSWFAVMAYADDSALRAELYEAWSTRASDQGPHAGQWDNREIMEEILALRHEKATLLGYPNYAEMALETRMAGSVDAVYDFLHDLSARALPRAREELDTLRAWAREQYGVDTLEPWDITWYSEKLRQDRYRISAEDLRPWFPEPQVMQGLFEIVERLYGMHIEANDKVDTWHPDVRFYEIRDSEGTLRGQFYTDLYARAGKQGGAWMDECRVRRLTPRGLQVPVAYLTCNFTPAAGGRPGLLTHDEVTTLFHEFGHGLHHMLTQIDVPAVSGINGVAWDAVELPSQFMENWCWERESLDLFAAHYETGEKLPEALYTRLREARNFQSAMQMVRQIEFSLFDFRLHAEYDPDRGARIYDTLEAVRDQTSVLRPPEWHRFPNSFSHIFAGGYAAGYYSYKWAEVLSADAFARFEEEGIFNPDTGRDFLHNILEQGGSRDALALFTAFRGRPPEIDALLRHTGLAA